MIPSIFSDSLHIILSFKVEMIIVNQIPLQRRVIVSGLEIVEAGFAVIIIAPVTDGIQQGWVDNEPVQSSRKLSCENI